MILATHSTESTWKMKAKVKVYSSTQTYYNTWVSAPVNGTPLYEVWYWYSVSIYMIKGKRLTVTEKGFSDSYRRTFLSVQIPPLEAAILGLLGFLAHGPTSHARRPSRIVTGDWPQAQCQISKWNAALRCNGSVSLQSQVFANISRTKRYIDLILFAS